MDNEAILVREQVKDLQKRTRAAIRQGNDALTYSLAMEYMKLLNISISSAIGASNSELEYQLELLLIESKTIPPMSKNNPLIQLKWLDNSISRLLIIVKRLYPIDTTLEQKLHPKEELEKISRELGLVDTTLELKLHPKVLSASEKLFQDGHYSQAVFEAFKALEEYVREKSGRKEYGEYLMSLVFNENNPILKIKYSRPDTATDEQKGFKFIFMGVMTGIKNPKGHHTISQRDKARTLQYLALASLLFKTVDDATLA